MAVIKPPSGNKSTRTVCRLLINMVNILFIERNDCRHTSGRGLFLPQPHHILLLASQLKHPEPWFIISHNIICSPFKNLKHLFCDINPDYRFFIAEKIRHPSGAHFCHFQAICEDMMSDCLWDSSVSLNHPNGHPSIWLN